VFSIKCASFLAGDIRTYLKEVSCFIFSLHIKNYIQEIRPNKAAVG
jgi:hypothetical protein